MLSFIAPLFPITPSVDSVRMKEKLMIRMIRLWSGGLDVSFDHRVQTRLYHQT
jgi:hypothetical protein